MCLYVCVVCVCVCVVCVCVCACVTIWQEEKWIQRAAPAVSESSCSVLDLDKSQKPVCGWQSFVIWSELESPTQTRTPCPKNSPVKKRKSIKVQCFAFKAYLHQPRIGIRPELKEHFNGNSFAQFGTNANSRLWSRYIGLQAYVGQHMRSDNSLQKRVFILTPPPDAQFLDGRGWGCLKLYIEYISSLKRGWSEGRRKQQICIIMRARCCEKGLWQLEVSHLGTVLQNCLLNWNFEKKKRLDAMLNLSDDW